MSEEFLKGWKRIDLFLHPPDLYPRAAELEIRRVETRKNAAAPVSAGIYGFSARFTKAVRYRYHSGVKPLIRFGRSSASRGFSR